jgi:hypothetical protein
VLVATDRLSEGVEGLLLGRSSLIVGLKETYLSRARFNRDELSLLLAKYGVRRDDLQIAEVLREAVLEASLAQLRSLVQEIGGRSVRIPFGKMGYRRFATRY